MNPQGKVILVTGASAGIGLATARALAGAGTITVLAARSLSTLEAECRSLSAAGREVMAVRLDVTDGDTVAAAVDAILARLGRIDAVINIAGNGGRLDLWADTDEAALRAMVDVHLFGIERVTRAVLPAMRRQGGGSIVNIASTVAWVPMPSAAAYCAAKAAVVALSEALRAELAGEAIDVRLFAPPHTSTEAGRAWPLEGPAIFPPEWVAAELLRFLRGRKPRHVAGASNRLLLGIRRIWPGYAAAIMRSIGDKALAASRQGGAP